MLKIATVILAAGQSTRMKSTRSKVLHDLSGRPVISYVIDAARNAAVSTDRIVVVRGPDQDDLKGYLREIGIGDVVQKKALGTANAVEAAKKALRDFKGLVLVLCGDIPLVRPEIISSFLKDVHSKKAPLGVLTMVPDRPENYGRVVRDLDGRVIKIAEARDATEDELKIREVNSGILCFDCQWLFKSLGKIRCDNAKGEYYLTDLIGIALKEGITVRAFHGEPAGDFLGINTRLDLAGAGEIMRERINTGHMRDGVGILDCRHTNIDRDVTIGVDTTIMPYSFILGETKVGEGCIIENGVVIRDAVIGDGVHIKSYSVVEGSRIADGAVIGPFARIRPESKIGRKARVGNFVELKKCELKEGAKANHLTYLGDASVGAGANVGCGTITCNYDGSAKHRTVIGDGAFIGSDTQFVAPVRVGRGAVIGAGSTITKDVPAGALALSRADQKNVKGWAAKRRKHR